MVLAARPTNTAEALTPSPTWKLQDLAKCISTGGRPPPQISWHSSLNGSETRETTELGPQPGTFTVTSFFSAMPSRHADGKNITCSVKHESAPEPELLLVNLSVPCEYVCACAQAPGRLHLPALLPALYASSSTICSHALDHRLGELALSVLHGFAYLF